MVIREQEPLNIEYSFRTLDGPITPNNQFFVRTHFPIPVIDESDWRLTVDGEVERELSISYSDLLALPARTAMALLECAGNGRAQLGSKTKGLLWESGAVSTAEWTGVPLSTVLEMAGVRDGAIEVILQGDDSGLITDEPTSSGAIAFERSLPLSKAMRPEVVLAYKMNGTDITREHGFPVRAVVGGWYGMASVKWVVRITVTAMPFHGYWQSLEYAYWRRDRGRPTLAPVAEIQVKAQIARPVLSERIPPVKPYRVFGAAWGGESDVAKVEVSVDDGKTWAEARLLGEAIPFAWRLWEYTWNVPDTVGRHQLSARATDVNGRTQPTNHDEDRRSFMINCVANVEVDVR